MYRAVERFADLQDDKHIYDIGEVFPRKGYSPSEKRLKELSGTENKIGKPVIEFFEDPVEEDRPKQKKQKK